MKDGTRYHGFLALSRHAKMLQKDLGFHLFSLHTALVMEAIWDRSNPHFGHVVGSQTEIAQKIGISQSALSRGIDKLQQKQYVFRRKGHVILKYFPLFLYKVARENHSIHYANLHDLYEHMHKINAKLQEDYAFLQESRTQNASKGLYVSSKDNLAFLSDDSEEIDVDELSKEIERFRKERSSDQ